MTCWFLGVWLAISAGNNSAERAASRHTSVIFTRLKTRHLFVTFATSSSKMSILLETTNHCIIKETNKNKQWCVCGVLWILWWRCVDVKIMISVVRRKKAQAGSSWFRGEVRGLGECLPAQPPAARPRPPLAAVPAGPGQGGPAPARDPGHLQQWGRGRGGRTEGGPHAHENGLLLQANTRAGKRIPLQPLPYWWTSDRACTAARPYWKTN